MKTGIVTGCNRGIGLATVELLIKSPKSRVIGSSTSGNNPLDYSNFKCLKLDLSVNYSIDDFIRNIGDIKLDYLINNAAVLIEKWDASEIKMEQLRKTFDINVLELLS